MKPMLIAVSLEKVSVCAMFLEVLGLFALEFKSKPPARFLASFAQAMAPQMSTTSDAVPIAIRARAVPVAIEVWGV